MFLFKKTRSGFDITLNRAKKSNENKLKPCVLSLDPVDAGWLFAFPESIIHPKNKHPNLFDIKTTLLNYNNEL